MKITNEGYAIVERDTHLGRWVVEHKRLDFDQNSLPQMMPYIVGGKTVLDIGANIGCYAYAFGTISSKVVCFEPNPEAFECLKYNLGNDKTFDLWNKAVSDKPVMIKSISDNDNIGMAYIEEDENGEQEAVVIDMNHWDSPITFIKIDVEGYELHVLRGAKNTIMKHRPVLVIEINDHTLKRTGVDRKEIFAWLTEHGYTYRNIYAEQGLNDDQLDIICFPK